MVKRFGDKSNQDLKTLCSLKTLVDILKVNEAYIKLC